MAVASIPISISGEVRDPALAAGYGGRFLINFVFLVCLSLVLDLG